MSKALHASLASANVSLHYSTRKHHMVVIAQCSRTAELLQDLDDLPLIDGTMDFLPHAQTAEHHQQERLKG